MRSTQARIFIWVFIAIALTFWVIQARSSNRYLSATEVSVAELGAETKRHPVHYVGSDGEYHFFEAVDSGDPSFFAARNRKVFKLPKAVWTPPEKSLLLRRLPIKVKDGKITVDRSNEPRRDHGDPDSGEDQDYVGS